MVWGGATLDAIARLRREAQQIGFKRSSIRPYQLGLSSAKESFDCMFLCDHCGYLSDTDPPCPHCARKAWIDLDSWGFAEALRAREEEARRNPPESVQWQVRMTSIAAGTAIGLTCASWLAFAGLLTLGLPLVIGCGAGAAALTHGLGRRRFGWSIMARRVLRPTRWRLPLPLVDAKAKTASTVSGTAEPRGPLLTAPFTGRPCIGYDLAVLFDAPNDAWPPIWVLREMRSCPFEIQGRPVDADAVSLAMPIVPIEKPILTDEQKRRFLRERGLFLNDGTFDLHETIIEPGGTYELLWPTLPAGAPPFIRGAPAALRRDPYR
jgi:hypothetical protein